MGIGSEGFVSLEMGRKFVGVELKDSYYRQALGNLAAATQRIQADMFTQTRAVDECDGILNE